VDAILHFQFYDDCGDLINLDLGGGFGLMRNPADAACFRHSPSPTRRARRMPHSRLPPAI